MKGKTNDTEWEIRPNTTGKYILITKRVITAVEATKILENAELEEARARIKAEHEAFSASRGTY